MRRLPLAALALATGCTASPPSVTLTEGQAQALVGRSAEEVVARLGPPAEADAASLRYQTRRSAPARATGFATVSLGGGTTSGVSAGRTVATCDWTFRLDSARRVAGWSNTGPLCPALQ